MPKKIEISHRTILFTIGVLITLWFLYFIRDILLQLFVAVMIMTILNPFVTRLAKFGVPRAASILLVYFTAIGLFVAAFAGIVPPLAEQTTDFVNKIPAFINQIDTSTNLGDDLINQLVSEIGRLPSQIARTVLSLFSNVFDVITTLIFAFYLLLSRHKMDDQIGTFFGEKNQKEIARIIDILEHRLGGWLRGQLSLMLLVGISTYIGLSLLGIPYALSLAILAGMLEIVPYIGPIFSAIPAVIIALGISPFMGLSALALSILVQQLENYVFVPKVMERTAGISPIITLLALAIGFKLAGIVGVLMSVPVVITLLIVGKEYFAKIS